MLEGAHPVQSDYWSSAAIWWLDAGVDVLVNEEPTPWLGRGRAARAAPSVEASPTPATFAPTDIAALTDYLGNSMELGFAGPPGHRVVAAGDPASPIMVMIDMPEMGDAAAGQLLGGEVGELFDRMLSAINRDRQSIYLAAFSPGRPPGGMLDQNAVSQLTPLAWRHIEFVGPKRLWLMGQTVSRAIGGADARPGAGDLRVINYKGVKVAAVASFSPRFLLGDPKRKKAAWADMQALTEGI